MMRDLSAVGEEWAEAPEWLPHFVTDHTDRLLLTSAAALLLVYRQTQTSIGQTDHTDRLLLVVVVYRQHRPHRQAAAGAGGGVQTTQTTIDHTDTASVAPAWI